MFLNDGTGGKLDYYLTTKVTVEDLRCTGPDPTATVRLDLDYEPPADVAALPAYVTGTAQHRAAGRVARDEHHRLLAGRARRSGRSAWTRASSPGTTGAPRPAATSQVVTSVLEPGARGDVPRRRSPSRDGAVERVDHADADQPRVRHRHLPS